MFSPRAGTSKIKAQNSVSLELLCITTFYEGQAVIQILLPNIILANEKLHSDQKGVLLRCCARFHKNSQRTIFISLGLCQKLEWERVSLPKLKVTAFVFRHIKHPQRVLVSDLKEKKYKPYYRDLKNYLQSDTSCLFHYDFCSLVTVEQSKNIALSK